MPGIPLPSLSSFGAMEKAVGSAPVLRRGTFFKMCFQFLKMCFQCILTTTLAFSPLEGAPPSFQETIEFLSSFPSDDLH